MTGPARITAKAGGATVEIDQSQVMAQVDRILGGALSTFVRAARRQMDPVVEEAVNNRLLWPRRTGRSQAATQVIERLTADGVEVVAINRVPYTYKIRYSVVTAETIDSEPREVASRTWAKLGPYVERADTEQGKRRIARKFISEASGGLINGWWSRRDVSERSIYQIWRKLLIDTHGTGAPNETLAGRNVWSTRLRKPLKKREDALITEAREALTRLAED